MDDLPDWFDPNNDPGNQFAEKPLSVRLQNIRDQWLNLGERQKTMLDYAIISAQWMEEKIRRLEAKQ